ncbi:MAG: N-acetylglucosamine kinase, partial [Ktedonobacterales bacterium]
MSEREREITAPLFLGVDGGGSKTLAVIVDAAGVERGRGRAGSSNHHTAGRDAALVAIHDAVGSACLLAGCQTPLTAAWVGLAGVDRPTDAAPLAARLDKLAGVTRLTNDAELALGGLPGGVGVALIAGTGSIAVGCDVKGTRGRASGWGHLLGDEGSGYDIGRQALRALARAADGRGPGTALVERVLARWGLTSPTDLLSTVYADPDKARVAVLAELVIAAATEGDTVSRGIVRAAVEELALAVRSVAASLDLASPLPLALSGGLLIHHDDMRRLVVERIQRTRPVGPVTLVEEPALCAARYLAREQAARESRDEPFAADQSPR